MNALRVGLLRQLDLPSGRFLLIDDELPDIGDWRRPKIFDPLKHAFNPLKGMTPRKAQELAEIFYTLSPQGENTLTVRNGRRALRDALMEAPRLDKVKGDEEVEGMMGDVLFSPTLKRVLCDGNFNFDVKTPILARINRVELGERDALILGLLLMLEYPHQLVIPDMGFYGRDIHTRIVREDRLIAGVNFLSELPPRLRDMMLLIPDKEGDGTIVEDAETLAKFENLIKGTRGYSEFVEETTG